MGSLLAISWAEREARVFDERILREQEIQAALTELRLSLAEADLAVAAYQGAPLEQFRGQFESARRQTADAQSRLAVRVSGDPQIAVEEIRNLISACFARLDTVLASRDTVSQRAERDILTDLQQKIAQFTQTADQAVATSRLQRDAARERFFRTMLLCGIMGPLGSLLLYLLATRRLVGRLRGLEENARRLAQGLPPGAPPLGTDEIAELGQQLNHAANLLRERERAARESEERYRNLFDLAPIPFEKIGADGRIRRANQAVCTLLQSTPEQIVGRAAWDFAVPDEQEAVRAALMDRLAAGRETRPFECEYQLENGAHLTVEIQENFIRNEHGDVIGAVRSLLDVTERSLASVASQKVAQYAMELRNRNEQLAQALEAARSATVAKSRFLASVSHELRTPLNGIIGLSELLFDQKVGPMTAEQRDVLGDILSSSRHLLQLISDILDLSKVEAGRMEFLPECRVLAELVSEVSDVVRPLAAKKELTLEVNVPSGLEAELDGVRFKQVLYNYLSNAIKFTPEGGSVRVRVALEGEDCFRLEVSDTGVGMETAELPRLFQEFGQLPHSRRAGQGTGLGLALTRHIVEAQGGSVGVTSERGKGSTFWAILPLAAQAKTATT